MWKILNQPWVNDDGGELLHSLTGTLVQYFRGNFDSIKILNEHIFDLEIHCFYFIYGYNCKISTNT